MYVEIYMPKYSDSKKNAWFNETNKSSIRTLSDCKKYIKNQTILSWNTEEIVEKSKSIKKIKAKFQSRLRLLQRHKYISSQKS